MLTQDAPVASDLRFSHLTLCVQVRIRHKTMWFELDSGNYTSWIDPQIATSLGLTVVRNPKNPTQRITLSVPQLDVGSARLRNRRIRPSRDGGIGTLVEGTSERVAGILGYNVLRFLGLVLDFRACRVWAMAPSQLKSFLHGYGSSGEATSLAALRTTSYYLPAMMGATLDGYHTDVEVDLGSFVSTVPAAVAPRLRHRLERGPNWIVGDFAGPRAYPFVFLQDLSFGSFGWQQLPALLSTSEMDRLPVLGWSVFAPLQWAAFDFSGGMVISKKQQDPANLLDTEFALHGVWQGEGSLGPIDGGALAAKDVRAAFGLPVVERNGRLAFALDPKRARAAQQATVFDSRRAFLDVGDPGEAKKVALTPLSAPLKPDEHDQRVADIPYQAPGAYLVCGSKWIELPPGEVLISADCRLEPVAVAGAPRPKRLTSEGA